MSECPDDTEFDNFLGNYSKLKQRFQMRKIFSKLGFEKLAKEANLSWNAYQIISLLENVLHFICEVEEKLEIKKFFGNTLSAFQKSSNYISGQKIRMR